MKKFINLLAFGLLLNLLGFIALLAYRVNFDIPATLQVIYAFAYSAVSPLIDFSTIDLLKGLQWFAVLLYAIASLLILLSAVKRIQLLRIMVSPIALVFSLSIILISINGYYQDAVAFDNLGANTDFFALILLPIQVANPGLRAIAFSGLIVSALLLTFVFHILIVIDSVRNPYVEQQGLMMPVQKEETIIAEELSTFVIPSQIKIFSPTVSSSPVNLNPSNQPETNSLFNRTPIIEGSSVSSLPEKSEIFNARQTVIQLKEKIRGLIRLQLLEAKQALKPTPLTQPVQESLPTEAQVAPGETPAAEETKPQEESTTLIQQQVNQAIATEIAQLEPKSKDQVTTLINEELIKYDSLNREVMESLVAEKIEQQIGNAIDQYKQEVGLIGEKILDETKSKLQSASSSSTQLKISNEELQQRIQEALESNSVFKKLITLANTSDHLGDIPNASSQVDHRPEITSTDVANMIQSQTLSQVQIQQLLDDQYQKLLKVIQQAPNKDLNKLMTKEQFNQAFDQLTQTKQDLIEQHQDIMTLKDVISQFQLETLGRLQPLQEKLQQYETNKVANIQIKPVEEAFIVALMQKHQSVLRPNESLEVISSMVAREVKKQTSEEPRIKAEDVERMITKAVERIPQPSPVVMPKVMSEEDISKLVESKLPKQEVPVINEAVVSSMVATEVKKQTSEEPRIKAEDVERMITKAVGRIPQPIPVVMPKVMSEEDISKLVESKLPRAINEEEIKRIVESKLPKQEVPVINEAVVSSMVATEVKKQTSEEPRIKAEDVERMINEAVGRLPKQIYIQENTNSNYTNSNSSYNSRMVTPTLTVPIIRRRNAKAPENDKRADQFKSVIAPEIGVTRTGKKKIVRIPFQDRMSKAEPMILSHYDELKNYILSFQVKSRISNAGDMFRLQKQEYVKITIAGKGLKLYMALNPEDYKDGPIPVDDASDKKMYKDIPLVFKVKSELSLKRAKKLIDDLMAKKGLSQQEIPFLPWSKAFQN